MQKAFAQNLEGKETRDLGGQGRYKYIGMTMNKFSAFSEGGLQTEGRQRYIYIHNGDPQEYQTRILTRKMNIIPSAIIEGLYIEGQVAASTMNKRKERGMRALVKLTAQRIS